MEPKNMNECDSYMIREPSLGKPEKFFHEKNCFHPLRYSVDAGSRAEFCTLCWEDVKLLPPYSAKSPKVLT
jgi:hypothetical protein